MGFDYLLLFSQNDRMVVAGRGHWRSPSPISLLDSVDPCRTLVVTGLQVDSATDYNPLSFAIQSVLSPPHHPLVLPRLPELAYENVMGDSVKSSLDEVQVDDIYCSPLTYPARCPFALFLNRPHQFCGLYYFRAI